MAGQDAVWAVASQGMAFQTIAAQHQLWMNKGCSVTTDRKQDKF
jgi:hypothetical protein